MTTNDAQIEILSKRILDLSESQDRAHIQTSQRIDRLEKEEKHHFEALCRHLEGLEHRVFALEGAKGGETKDRNARQEADRISMERVHHRLNAIEDKLRMMNGLEEPKPQTPEEKLLWLRSKLEKARNDPTTSMDGEWNLFIDLLLANPNSQP